MGKKRLEELRNTNVRLGRDWCEIAESNDNCPICDGKLFSTRNTGYHVMDGNTIYHCDNEDEHTFWRNAIDMDNVLHLNEDASESDFKYEAKYNKNKNGRWELTEQKTYTLADIKQAIDKSPIFDFPSHYNKDRIMKATYVNEFLFQLKLKK